MILLKDIKGQHNAVRYLVNNLRDGRIANSYLFSGQDGVGRSLAAKAFIAALMCPQKSPDGSPCGVCPVCARVDSLDHPDITWISSEKNRAIKIESVRKAKKALSLKPFESPVSVCVIEDAHMMTVEASNALLKLLEEPPGRSLLILITSKKELLLPTVISRCVEVRFCPLPAEDTKNMILENSDGLDDATASFLAYFSQGSPGRAMEMIEEGVLERKERIAGIVSEVLSSGQPSCCVWDEESRDALIEDLELAIMMLRDTCLAREGVRRSAAFETGLDAILDGYSADDVYAVIERLIGLKLALLGNVNAKLAAQVLPGMLRP